jgi:hypothetical protein
MPRHGWNYPRVWIGPFPFSRDLHSLIILKSKKTGNYIQAVPMVTGHLFVGWDGDPDGNRYIDPIEASQRYFLVDGCPKDLDQILSLGYKMEWTS